MYRTLIIICLMLMPLSSSATEITPMGGYTFGGKVSSSTGQTLKFDDGGSFALAIDQNIGSGKQLELFWSHQQASLSGGGVTVFDSGIDYIHLGGTVLYPQEKVIPYVVGGLGVTLFSPDGGYKSETRFSISIGGGIKTFVTERIGLRLEGRGYVTWFPEEGYLFCGNNNCTIVANGDALFQFEGLAGVILKF